MNKLYTIRKNVVYDSTDFIKYFYSVYWKSTSLIYLNKIKPPDFEKIRKSHFKMKDLEIKQLPT